MKRPKKSDLVFWISFSLVIILVLLLIYWFMVKGCPTCEKLFADKNDIKEGFASETAVTRAMIMRSYDIECLTFFCTNDCAKNETDNKTRQLCMNSCRDAGHLDTNSKRYTQCRHDYTQN